MNFEATWELSTSTLKATVAPGSQLTKLDFTPNNPELTRADIIKLIIYLNNISSIVADNVQ